MKLDMDNKMKDFSVWGNFELAEDLKISTHELARPNIWSVKLGFDEILDQNDACLDFG